MKRLKKTDNRKYGETGVMWACAAYAKSTQDSPWRSCIAVGRYPGMSDIDWILWPDGKAQFEQIYSYRLTPLEGTFSINCGTIGNPAPKGLLKPKRRISTKQ